MNNEQNFHYVETDSVEFKTPAEEPKAKGILSLVFGIVSIVLGGVIGIVLGVLARRFATPIIADFAGTVSAKLAKAGKITGTVGLVLSIVGMIVCAVVIACVAALVISILSTGADLPIADLFSF
ncbi:MAG: hypothetical protein IJ011_04600 [Clostridia bacterium]|nr:hypothetical protein [Clostridia bacterium]